MARVLPYMTFTTVVDNPIQKQNGELQSPLSKDDLPYEDDYNDAIAEILRSVLKYTVSRPKNPVTGKTDVLVTYNDARKCAIETIMSSQTMVRFEVSELLCQLKVLMPVLLTARSNHTKNTQVDF